MSASNDSGTLSISPEIGAIHWPTKTELPPLKKPHLNLLRQALKVARYFILILVSTHCAKDLLIMKKKSAKSNSIKNHTNCMCRFEF